MEIETLPIRRLQLSAGLIGLIGITGLILLFAQDGRAEGLGNRPGPGAAGGAKNFNSPFPTTPRTGGQYFDEEDEEDPSFAEDEGGYQNGQGRPGGARAGGGAGPGAGNPGGGGDNGAVSLGGNENASGVVSNNKRPTYHVDDETGSGSKEVVTDFNFPDADILDIAKTLSKLTGKNLILDKDVKGRITIISNSKITVGDAWKAFLTALDINGFALIPSGNFIRIARNRDARDKQVKTYTGDSSPDTDALITRVFPLKYISAEEVARVFRSFTPANSRIVPYEQTNTVIVTDTGSNIAKLSKMLEILDVEGYDAGIEVIPVKYASASELAKLIDTLIPGTGGGAGGPPGAPRFGGGGGGGGRFQSRRTKEGGIINTIIPDERSNTLILHANTKGADQVRELIAKLDQKTPAQTGGGKVHVIYLQFAEAEKIANTLNSLSQSTPGGSRPGGPAGGGLSTGTNPVTQNLFEGNIKVAPDVATNSLVVTASPGDFTTVQRVVNKLDIPRDEVFTEVVIMEVALNKQSDFSANIINPTNGIGSVPSPDLFNFIKDPTSINGGVFNFRSGATTTLSVGSQSFTVSSVTAMIKAIQKNTKTNVLATPQIIALDNTEATFESAEQIPVATTNVNQGVITSGFTKEKVSLSITIKPQINKISNFVKLDVTAKDGQLTQNAPAEVQGKAFSTLDRTAKTTVVVGDKDTVVLGGLIRDRSEDTTSKVPLLGDIPILGWLFKANSKTVTKTNLLIFITPHIIKQYERVRAILDKKLRERDEYLEKNNGGEDPYRDVRDNMIRSLPDMEELKKKPQTAVSIDEDAPAAVPVDGSPFTGGGDSSAGSPAPNGQPAGPVAQPPGGVPAPGGNP